MRNLNFVLKCFIVSFAIVCLFATSTWSNEPPPAQISSSQTQTEEADPDTPVSSDGLGLIVEAPQLTGELESESSNNVVMEDLAGGEPSYRGTASEGVTDDSSAESAETEESVEELIELLSLEPASDSVSVESIIGTDQRVRVNTTTSFPARAVALVEYDGGRCTGWLYGKDIVATAGHCVHDGGKGGSWKTHVRVYPGRNGTYSPYGSCSAKRLYSVKKWIERRDDEYDYGAIKLNCSIGNTTGWFGYWWQSASLKNLPSIINGYPGDKPLEQWKSSNKIKISRKRQVLYQNDTLPGMSGAPVYYNRPSGSPYCTGYCSMAIHAKGLYGSPPYSRNNRGTRITKKRFENLKAWRDAA